ncbi:hypothetical protein HDU76_000065 [Blyttiomyces sp. JEL0837]|nr:hypothetical protein HDU76_000065 [Blyttiomyces sp. JEL0837]
MVTLSAGKPASISIRKQHPISKTAGVNVPLNAIYLSGYQVPVTLGNGQKFNLSVAFSSGFTWFRGTSCVNPSNDGSCDGPKVDTTGMAASSMDGSFNDYFSDNGFAVITVKYKTAVTMGGLTGTISIAEAYQLNGFYASDFGDGFFSFDDWVGPGLKFGSILFESSWFYNVPGHTGNGPQTELGSPSGTILVSMDPSLWYWGYYSSNVSYTINNVLYKSTVTRITVIYDMRYNFIALPDDITNNIYMAIGASLDTTIGAVTVKCNKVSSLPVVSVSVQSQLSPVIFNISPDNCLKSQLDRLHTSASLLEILVFEFQDDMSDFTDYNCEVTKGRYSRLVLKVTDEARLE